jgi:hypothetical protein
MKSKSLPIHPIASFLLLTSACFYSPVMHHIIAGIAPFIVVLITTYYRPKLCLLSSASPHIFFFNASMIKNIAVSHGVYSLEHNWVRFGD